MSSHSSSSVQIKNSLYFPKAFSKHSAKNSQPSLTMKFVVWYCSASVRLSMGSRRGFICRMKVGSLQTSGDMAAAQGLHRMKQRNSLGPPGRDGQSYAVVHCTGYIKNWPPTGEFGMVLNIPLFRSAIYLFTFFFRSLQIPFTIQQSHESTFLIIISESSALHLPALVY